MNKLAEGFKSIGDFVIDLTPEERRSILAFEWPEMFAWWDDKWYCEGKPMIVRGLGLSHHEARFLWLLVGDMVGFMDCGSDDE